MFLAVNDKYDEEMIDVGATSDVVYCAGFGFSLPQKKHSQ